ncbi:MAG: methylated-DNA--[protein]-cysteine S-methyltransferase [Patescibacteria group bacterium]
MSFFADVYQVVRKVPRGKVTTYGEIARVLGTKDARKVGWALHANNDPKTPCHRVVDREGKLAPNFAFDGEVEQKRRLLSEGVSFKGKHVNLKKHLFTMV